MNSLSLPEEPGSAGELDTRGYVARGFVHFSRRLRYAIRLGASAAAARIEDPLFDGAPLAHWRERTFSVVFTNYLGAGGYPEAWNGSAIGSGVRGGIAGFDLRALPKHDTGLVFRNEIIAYARAASRIGAATGARLDGRLAVL